MKISKKLHLLAIAVSVSTLSTQVSANSCSRAWTGAYTSANIDQFSRGAELSDIDGGALPIHVKGMWAHNTWLFRQTGHNYGSLQNINNYREGGFDVIGYASLTPASNALIQRYRVTITLVTSAERHGVSPAQRDTMRSTGSFEMRMARPSQATTTMLKNFLSSTYYCMLNSGQLEGI